MGHDVYFDDYDVGGRSRDAWSSLLRERHSARLGGGAEDKDITWDDDTDAKGMPRKRKRGLSTGGDNLR